MTAYRTHYELLGVPRDVDDAGLRAAWRSLARTTHPDAGGDTAAFQELAHAYDVLSHRGSRALYDEALAMLLPDPSARPRDDRSGPEQQWDVPSWHATAATGARIVREEDRPSGPLSEEFHHSARRRRLRADSRKAAWQWLGLALLGVWLLVSLTSFVVGLFQG